MKISKLQMTAVIPVQQYGNLQPSIEISEIEDFELANERALSYMKEIFAKYSEKGGLTELTKLTEKDVITSNITMKSFNEDVEIDFEPINHVYTHKGSRLTGVTDYISKFFKPFNVDTISSILESKWGVPQKIIKNLWEDNGKLTSDFGSAIHFALEKYQKNKEYGEIISSQKGDDENYCLPKHPILRQIVQGFADINKDEEGTVHTEVLVSSVKDKICGQIDRLVVLDKEKKICRIKDYKVNINSEKVDKSYKVMKPFNDLPSTKLSKYQLQLSVYANLLEKSGWTVVGLDVFVYENTWKHFEFPVLQII